MSASTPNRHPRGIPAGGQFAAGRKGEGVGLPADASEWGDDASPASHAYHRRYCRDDGTVEFRDRLGFFHNPSGPAVVYPDGGEEFFQHGKRSRLEGPAVHGPGVADRFFVGGVEVPRHKLEAAALEHWETSCQTRDNGDTTVTETHLPHPRGGYTTVVTEGSTVRYFDADGLAHREDGPAVVTRKGFFTKDDESWVHGVRVDGSGQGRKRVGWPHLAQARTERTGMWTFDRDYENLDQVEPFAEAFDARTAELEAAGRFAYNGEYTGRLGPSLAGEGEDTAIYLLQKRKSVRAYQAEMTSRRQDGYVDVPADLLDGTHRYANITVFGGQYDGGTHGTVTDLEGGRVVVRGGKFVGILPKGKRTHGFAVGSNAVVLVRR